MEYRAGLVLASLDSREQKNVKSGFVSSEQIISALPGINLNFHV